MQTGCGKAALCGLALLALTAPTARAGGCRTGPGFRADEGEGRLGRTLLRNSDLFNGLLWFGGGAALRFGVDPGRDWTGTNSSDRSVRDDLAAASRDGRGDAAAASDGLLLTGLLAPLVLDAGIKSAWWDRDCERALEVGSDWVESIGLIWMITEAAKGIAGRERPFGLGCDRDPGYSSSCDDETRYKSFFSGHAALSAGGAALLCKDALRRNVWGESRASRALLCGFGVGASLGTGMLRMVADKHWLTDVIAGWVVGGAIGWFDLPGPFDLLRFRTERDGREVTGLWVPTLGPDSIGLGVALRF